MRFVRLPDICGSVMCRAENDAGTYVARTAFTLYTIKNIIRINIRCIQPEEVRRYLEK